MLGEVLKKGKPLSFTQRVLYLWQAADAMAEMHAKGAIHDDFHAYNIFLRCDQSRETASVVIRRLLTC